MQRRLFFNAIDICTYKMFRLLNQLLDTFIINFNVSFIIQPSSLKPQTKTIFFFFRINLKAVSSYNLKLYI